MTTQIFLGLLIAFSAISSLITEGIKKIATDKVNLSYNILALVVALIVGGVGMGIYYQLNGIAFTVNNIIYMVLMSLASSIGSMVGFDKAKQAIVQITNIKENAEE